MSAASPLSRPHLQLVPPVVPDVNSALLARIKTAPRPAGILQCNRCGSRSAMTVVTGAFIKNGRVQGGTVTAKHECAMCWKQGITSAMLPELKSV